MNIKNPDLKSTNTLIQITSNQVSTVDPNLENGSTQDIVNENTKIKNDLQDSLIQTNTANIATNTENITTNTANINSIAETITNFNKEALGLFQQSGVLNEGVEVVLQFTSIIKNTYSSLIFNTLAATFSSTVNLNNQATIVRAEFANITQEKTLTINLYEDGILKGSASETLNVGAGSVEFDRPLSLLAGKTYQLKVISSVGAGTITFTYSSFLITGNETGTVAGASFSAEIINDKITQPNLGINSDLNKIYDLNTEEIKNIDALLTPAGINQAEINRSFLNEIETNQNDIAGKVDKNNPLVSATYEPKVSNNLTTKKYVDELIAGGRIVLASGTIGLNESFSLIETIQKYKEIIILGQQVSPLDGDLFSRIYVEDIVSGVSYVNGDLVFAFQTNTSLRNTGTNPILKVIGIK